MVALGILIGPAGLLRAPVPAVNTEKIHYHVMCMGLACTIMCMDLACTIMCMGLAYTIMCMDLACTIMCMDLACTIM